ncbi:hypothetical protein LCGC14_0628180 [marine sediment metagenome]|uniref:Uncharacterized protein n=1 Tax=marine sediment metagenome TaxID=412755 RepID=A0A0F9UBA7_9ZZZZ
MKKKKDEPQPSPEKTTAKVEDKPVREAERKPVRESETAVMEKPAAESKVPGRPEGAPPQSEVALEWMTRSHHVYKLKNNKKICILIKK